MSKTIHIKIILFIIFGSFTLKAQDKSNYSPLLKYEGREYFINGMNIAWNKFGGDFGRHDVWGSMYDSVAFENIFTKCEDHGVNVVRLWIHCDGRSSPDFKNGYCTGFDTDFYLDLDDCFRRAAKHNVMIMPCMWSFDMCKDFRESAGPMAGAHDDLLTDTAKMNSYIKNAFIPIVKRYKNQCNLFAWEVCNEPEWALDRQTPGYVSYDTSKAWTYRTKVLVPIESMQLLAAKMAEVVHTYSDKMITIGSSAIRWNSDVSPSVGNLWSDKSLQKIYPNEKAYMDFYQVHYYDYMHPSDADPFDSTKDTKHWKFDKPIIIGECPASDERSNLYTPDEMISLAKKNGYAGIMFWSHNGDDGVGEWDDFKDALKKNYKENPEDLNMDDCPCKYMQLADLDLDISKGKKVKIKIQDADPVLTSSYMIEMKIEGKESTKTIKSGYVKSVNKFKLKKGATDIRIFKTDIYGLKRETRWKSLKDL